MALIEAGLGDGVALGEGVDDSDGWLLGVGEGVAEHTAPSSTRPLQSSSMPLHISGVGSSGTQRVLGTPAMHLEKLRWQAPTPQVIVPQSPSSI